VKKLDDKATRPLCETRHSQNSSLGKRSEKPEKLDSKGVVGKLRECPQGTGSPRVLKEKMWPKKG